jgi:hypothetical protein
VHDLTANAAGDDYHDPAAAESRPANPDRDEANDR